HSEAGISVLDYLLSRRVERTFHHRALHERPLSASVSLLQRNQGGERPVHARKRITRPALDTRLIIRVAGEPGQSRHLLHGLSEAYVIPPGPGQPECWHPNHDSSRILPIHGRPIETELLHDTG